MATRIGGAVIVERAVYPRHLRARNGSNTVSTISRTHITAENAAIGVRRINVNEVEVSFVVKDDFISVHMSDLQAGKLHAGLLMAFPPRALTSVGGSK